ncbi:uncharacterized protein LOC113946104 [Corapipo altera]|uniref:uncharacterized protein LOC113946104 n=1 Tax=Corapipo altera TaxID=415028 RepID=UPI000FD6B4CC|nr:uncharacterized protein LOC113946104 [Corapipo altera]XP_027496846.1 uncharacterized protein LOC113946104 [Corapipo altera]
MSFRMQLEAREQSGHRMSRAEKKTLKEKERSGSGEDGGTPDSSVICTARTDLQVPLRLCQTSPVGEKTPCLNFYRGLGFIQFWLHFRNLERGEKNPNKHQKQQKKQKGKRKFGFNSLLLKTPPQPNPQPLAKANSVTGSRCPVPRRPSPPHNADGRQGEAAPALTTKHLGCSRAPELPPLPHGGGSTPSEHCGGRQPLLGSAGLAGKFLVLLKAYIHTHTHRSIYIIHTHLYI